MHIEVKQHRVELQHSIKDSIHRHIATDLKRFDRMIKCVCVHITDINGPRGGEDKRCRIQIHLKRAASVVVENRGVSLLAVIGRAVAQVNTAMSRTAGRIRNHRRFKLKASINQPCTI